MMEVHTFYELRDRLYATAAAGCSLIEELACSEKNGEKLLELYKMEKAAVKKKCCLHLPN